MKNTILILLSTLSVAGIAQKEDMYTVIQKGHSEVVKSATFSPDGKLMATASRDKSVKLWDVETGHEIRTFLGFDHTVNDLDFSEDGRLLATSSADNYARIWDIRTGEMIWESPQHEGYVTSVDLHSENPWIAEGGFDRFMVVYNYNTSDTIVSIKVNADKGVGTGIDLKFSPDGKWLAIGEDNRVASVYRTDTWELEYTFQPEEGWCGGCGTAVNFSNDSKYLAKVSNRNTAEIYTLRSGELQQLLKNEVDDFRSIEFNSDNTRLILTNEDSVWIFNPENGELISEFKPEVEQINDATFHPDDPVIAISGNDNKTTLWSLEGRKLKTYSGILNDRDKGGIQYDPNNYWESHIAKYVKYRNDLYLSDDGSYMLRGKVGKKARLWEVNSGQTKMEFIGHEKAVLAFDLTEDEKFLVSGGGDGKVILWNVENGKKIREFKGHRQPVFDLSISNDEKYVASSGWDGYVMVWNIETGERVSLINLDNVAAYSLEFTPNDVYVLLGKLDNTLELWEIDSRTRVKDFIGHTGYVNKIVWSDNSREFFSLGNDGSAISWDMHTGLINRKFKHKGSVHSLAILNENQLITGGSDRKVRIWNRKNGTIEAELDGHKTEITSININVGDNLLVTGDLDGVIKFWKLNTRELFFEHIQMGDVDWMVMTSDGHFYATSGAMENIHFVRSLQTFDLDQFYEEFYNPELLPELFSKGGKGRSRDMNGLLQQSPPPEVQFARAPEFAEESVELMLRIIDQGGGINDLRLFHNGKRLDDKSVQLELIDKKSGQLTYSFKAELVAGHNVFSAKAYSDKNIASPVVEVDVQSNSTIPGSVCYVLSIGINTYKNPKLSLNYARADALAFVASVKEFGKEIYAKVEVMELYDSEATKSNILHSLDQLISNAQINDVVMIYYAGHGSVVDEEFYLIPTELTRLYDSRAMDDAIPASLLQEKLLNIKSLKQVIIMDACQSGKSLEVLSQRGVLEEKAISQLSRSAGIHVMASAGSEQYAGEYEDLGHGLFTYALLEVLSGTDESSIADKKITIYEIKSYLDERVPELSYKYKGTPQYPHSFSRGQDFPVGLINEN